MPSIDPAPKSGATSNADEQRSITALREGTIKPIIKTKGSQIDIVEATVQTHDKLKVYLDTKPKDDSWSPYAAQNVAKGASGKGQM